MTAVRIARRIAASALALSMALTLGACATHTEGGGPDPGLRGQWQLEGGTDAGGNFDPSGQHITLTVDRDAVTSGRSSCSNYSARFFGTLSSLWVTTSHPAHPACGNQLQQDLEERYFNDLSAVRGATIAGGVLHLTGPDIDLHYQLALDLPLGGVIDQLWTLSGVSSVPLGSSSSRGYVDVGDAQDLRTPVTLRFEKGGAFDGQSGCHLLKGTYVQNAGQLVIQRLVSQVPTSSSATAGCDSAAFAVDTYLMSVLSSGFTFLASQGSLTLTSTRAEINLHFT
jgi:heat shock protein HslJ